MGFQAKFDSKPSATVQAHIDAAPGAVNTAAALQNLKAVAPGVMTGAELARKQADLQAKTAEVKGEPAPKAPSKIDAATVSKQDMVDAMQNMISHLKAAERRIKEMEARLDAAEKSSKMFEGAFDELSMHVMNNASNTARQISALRTKLGKTNDGDVVPMSMDFDEQ